MTNVYMDNFSAAEAQKLFNHFADKEYISNAECNLSGYSSSVRLEAYAQGLLFHDLAEFFRNA